MSVNHRPFLDKKLSNDSGFTLLELMITVSIAGILLGIAIPSFMETIRSNRLTTNANELVTALNLARSEAIKRSVQVTVGKTAATTNWEGGWNVFIDVNANNLYNAGTDTLLRTYAALPGGYTLRTGANTYQRYSPSGLSTVAVDTFKLCSGSGTTQRTIAISATGRPSVASPTGGTCP